MGRLNNDSLRVPVDFFPPVNGIHISPGWCCLENVDYLIKTVSSWYCTTWLIRRFLISITSFEHPLIFRWIKWVEHRSFYRGAQSQMSVASHGQTCELILKRVREEKKNKIRAHEVYSLKNGRYFYRWVRRDGKWVKWKMRLSLVKGTGRKAKVWSWCCRQWETLKIFAWDCMIGLLS